MSPQSRFSVPKEPQISTLVTEVQTETPVPTHTKDRPDTRPSKRSLTSTQPDLDLGLNKVLDFILIPDTDVPVITTERGPGTYPFDERSYRLFTASGKRQVNFLDDTLDPVTRGSTLYLRVQEGDIGTRPF